MDPISLAVGAVILGVGWLIGRIHRPQPASQPPLYQCTCGHPFSDHDPKTDACHGAVAGGHARTSAGDYIGIQRLPCTCRRYVGEYPIDITTLGLPGMPPDMEHPS